MPLLAQNRPVCNGIVTPLILAILNSWQDVIELLIQNGANVNDTDGFKNTPLHYAVWLKNIEAVESLLKNGADLSMKNHKNFTALDLAKKISF